MQASPHLLAIAMSSALCSLVFAQQPPVDVASMDRTALERELRAARPLMQNGGVQAQRPPGCTSPQSRQFDFWLGEWDVSPTGQEFVIAESTISAHAQGCVILENWRPLQGPHGYSINSYDANDKLWHQEYVDASGRRTPYAGRFADATMSMDNLGPTPPNSPTDTRRRMNFRALDNDTVRQWGESSRDGKTWQVAWDLTYRRRPGTRR